MSSVLSLLQTLFDRIMYLGWIQHISGGAGQRSG